MVSLHLLLCYVHKKVCFYFVLFYLVQVEVLVTFHVPCILLETEVSRIFKANAQTYEFSGFWLYLTNRKHCQMVSAQLNVLSDILLIFPFSKTKICDTVQF